MKPTPLCAAICLASVLAVACSKGGGGGGTDAAADQAPAAPADTGAPEKVMDVGIEAAPCPTVRPKGGETCTMADLTCKYIESCVCGQRCSTTIGCVSGKYMTLEFRDDCFGGGTCPADGRPADAGGHERAAPFSSASAAPFFRWQAG